MESFTSERLTGKDKKVTVTKKKIFMNLILGMTSGKHDPTT
jgi:hypothetical protein